ncbi:MAG: matrixin family metalloprotease [Acidobacteriota bacterium]
MTTTRSGAFRVAVLAAVFFALPNGAPSYVASGGTWRDGAIVMQLQLGSSNGALIDGFTSWGASAESALATWNGYLSRVEFRVVRDSTAGVAMTNGSNNVFWSSTAYGRDFDDYASGTQRNGVAALTLTWITSGRLSEADVIFRNTLSWNSYRGPTRRTSTGANLLDFRRFAMHEFGHVLGLSHPNDYGQNTTAIMNSVLGDLDTLAGDDIQGAQFLYGASTPAPPPTTTPPVVISFPPRNESLDFRNQLEVKYRDGLRRGGSPTSVDNEGDVVWTQEYLRFRVNQCAHAAAVSRVMSEIDGGTSDVCGSAAGGQVNFPPRNESLDFRTQLEAKYRDGLRRSPILTSVDNEGDVVWTQEYLRYRVNGCAHGDSVQRVFLQIDGRGIQSVCR